jgi:hypothetical protein
MLGSIRFPLTSFGVVTTVMLLSASSLRAQGDDESARGDAEEEFDRTPRKCVSTTRIRNTDVLDDRTIIFYLRGNRDVYRNYLPRECPGLERNDRFSYHARNSQLCSVDTITVLEQIGGRLDATFTCALGEFIPITQEEAEDLMLDRENQGRKRSSISSEPAELPPEGADAQEAPADETAADEAQAEEAAPAPEEPRRRQRRGSGTTAR